MAHKKKFKAVVNHSGDDFTFSINIPLLGNKSIKYVLDNTYRPGTAGDIVSFKAYAEGNVIFSKVKRIPPGKKSGSEPFLVVTRYELDTAATRGLSLIRRLYIDGNDDRKCDSQMSLFFTREG